jgi:hypothetical protein
MKGQIKKCSGDPKLECMCGCVIGNNLDKDNPFFTDFGSFYTGNTSSIIGNTGDIKTRNTCNCFGYETVVLIPLKASEGALGLIQVNDKRTDFISIDTVHFLEDVASSIADVFKRINRSNNRNV